METVWRTGKGKWGCETDRIYSKLGMKKGQLETVPMVLTSVVIL